METIPDVTQALKDTENALRDFIAVVLRAKLGESWLEYCGISAKKIEDGNNIKRMKKNDKSQAWLRKG